MLNANNPHFECWINGELLGVEELLPGVAHAVVCVEGRAVGFHVLLHNGAHIGRVPIHCVFTKPVTEKPPLHEPWTVQLWDCFSYACAVTEFDWLSQMRCRVALANGDVHGGEYLFTVDYFGNAKSEGAGETGWKCHHIIALDNGWIAAQPNNRVCFFEPSSVAPFDQPPKYKTILHTFHCEDGAKWRATGDGEMFYGVQERKRPEQETDHVEP